MLSAILHSNRSRVPSSSLPPPPLIESPQPDNPFESLMAFFKNAQNVVAQDCDFNSSEGDQTNSFNSFPPGQGPFCKQNNVVYLGL
jgi:hypothetical protein